MSLQSIVVQATKPHTATFIFLHGLGDSGHGWSQLGEMLSPMFPHVKFVFPNAPSIPITLNGGYRMPGWYDIMSLDPKTRKEDESGMLQTVEIINKLLAEEISGGIKSKRIVLGGFSQGSAMSLLTSIKTDIKLGGIVGFSGYLPLADKVTESATSANQWTPYFMGHGDVDEVVAFEWGRMSADKLKESMGRQVTFKTYKGMGHSYCNQEVSDLAKFLGEVVPATEKGSEL
ncbi:Phospholipase/carboxylesterase/thioesterase [Chytriomyces cf. hyalinus JEL632]|nr:Phospholipase/carboxylesterase/thioesterase [Chytriomyces cf. hyalinus JEL632]